MSEIWNFFKSLGRIAKTFFWDMPIFTIWHAMPIMQGEGGWRTKAVGAGLKLTICAGLKLTRRYSGVAYYTAVGKSTRLGRL